MAVLFIGCRVRLVGEWLDDPASNPRGMEGRIVGRDCVGNVTKVVREWLVAVDDYGPVAADSCELEPVLPSGHQPCDTEFKRDLDRLLEGVAA